MGNTLLTPFQMVPTLVAPLVSPLVFPLTSSSRFALRVRSLSPLGLTLVSSPGSADDGGKGVEEGTLEACFKSVFPLIMPLTFPLVYSSISPLVLPDGDGKGEGTALEA
ncbi:uncharacterized protein EI90DRAFT_3073090 [Cantharellus anzutake]|uniref:uncharacterized protein n=1 Tax=Cantharellus anzutake TaxID=1750568 RepID=UPI00190395BC|nr:uncharacterized protein EI90DRAFT_3073090 [Cantharellus anzutake]KAF8325149.1 hypothetical protein EI90DRAFT_3073090 [Cantharellus anzutake]